MWQNQSEVVRIYDVRKNTNMFGNDAFMFIFYLIFIFYSLLSFWLHPMTDIETLLYTTIVPLHWPRFLLYNKFIIDQWLKDCKLNLKLKCVWSHTIHHPSINFYFPWLPLVWSKHVKTFSTSTESQWSKFYVCDQEFYAAIWREKYNLLASLINL